MDGNAWLKALNKLLTMVQRVVLLSGWFLAALVLGLTIKSGLQPFLAMFLASLLVIISVLVHEGGHYLGARWCGMPVLQVRIAAVELQVLRRGWRLRWSPQLKRNRLGGYVMAASNPQRPLRGQWMVVALSGPLLNLLVGGAALGLGLHWQGVPGAMALAFAVINLVMGVGNLLPAWRVSPSDGMLLLSWYVHRDDQRPELAQARLLALTVAGVPSAQLPAQDLERLGRGAMPEPLVAFGYRLNARQDQGDWLGVLQMEQELDELLAARAGELTGMSVLIELLRGELVFSRAYLQRDASILKGLPLGADVDWYAPWLRPRCLALQAILEGDRQQGEAYVQQALQAAQSCVVLSQGKSEALLAEHLRALPGP
ncbi:site-2 protease family protein [Pseudomonas protegens]|uniref:metalloprotease n=1 Tax=Pseudomonas protegens TaxID=380021 RepID=UPI002744C91C|nr:site-2 protease family protein [Pseudomonas protegens]MDP9502332.1 site-2 protease family protein [Pseudomonas protegens]